MFGKEKSSDCPLWRGDCRESKCRWWTHVIGTNPNTGETINKQGCAVEFLPVLLVENAQQARQTGASVDSFRNEMVRMNGVAAVQQSIVASGEETPLIEKHGTQ